MDRNIITAADLQKLLRVCADMPDRLTAARAKALLLVNILTDESSCIALVTTPCSMTLLARCPVALA